MRILRISLLWGGLWLLLVLGICLVGAFGGVLLFPLFGHLLGMDLTTAEMLQNGAFDGAFLALIWAPGISFIACVMLARRRRVASRAKA